MGALVAFANQKGGVGKTTLTVHMAVGLTQAGKRVVVVDADPQGNLTNWIAEQPRNDMYQLLIGISSAAKAVWPVKEWNLGLVGGGPQTGKALTMLSAVNDLSTIPPKLRDLAKVADVVLIDMPPSRLSGFEEILSAADWIVVPTILERMSLEGVTLTARTVVDIGKQNSHQTRLAGIVPNMVRGNTNEHIEQLRDLVNVFKSRVWPPIPETIRMAEANSRGTTLFEWAPNEKATEAIRKIVDRLVGVLDG